MSGWINTMSKSDIRYQISDIRKGLTLIRTRLRRNLVNIHGFTLIELLVSISIIAILISLSVFGLQGARE